MPGGRNYWLLKDTVAFPEPKGTARGPSRVHCVPASGLADSRTYPPESPDFQKTNPMDQKTNPLDEKSGKPLSRYRRGSPPKLRNDAVKRVRERFLAPVAVPKSPLDGRHRPFAVNIVQIRKRTRLTQEQFARRFGIPLGTLRHWERGDRKPRTAALAMLNLIARDPGAATRALKPDFNWPIAWARDEDD
jgi:putative transcriptional regulator